MIQKALFGRTGHESSRAIFGAAALWDMSQEVADRTLDVLLEYGVNHIDTAASYGQSEDHIGPWMKRYRDQFFLATKTGERTKAKAWDEFRRSLDRLQTDHVDLLQLHFLVDEEEWQTAMGPDGALEAVLEAQAQGLTRFVGVTGHELSVTRMHMRSLERHDFDSVLLPYNYPLSQNATYQQEFETLLDRCRSAKRRRADHQVGCGGPLGREAAHSHDVVRNAGGPARPRPRRVVRAGAARGLSEHRGRRQPAAEGPGSGEPVRKGAHAKRKWR